LRPLVAPGGLRLRLFERGDAVDSFLDHAGDDVRLLDQRGAAGESRSTTIPAETSRARSPQSST
jgi:hypothetical protein